MFDEYIIVTHTRTTKTGSQFTTQSYLTIPTLLYVDKKTVPNFMDVVRN